MQKVLLVRFGEVHLKGLNRPYFLRMLTENVKRAVKDLGGRVWLSDSRIYVADVEDMDECARRGSVTSFFTIRRLSTGSWAFVRIP